jgi:hypothetical protein
MRAWLGVSAFVEASAGLALLGLPALAVTLLIGTPPEGALVLVLARVVGAALLALAVACWIAKGVAGTRAALGVVAAMMIYDLAAVGILASAALVDGLHGVALWPAVVLHMAMSLWCASSLRSGGQM